jgi:hypothetical protein
MHVVAIGSILVRRDCDQHRTVIQLKLISGPARGAPPRRRFCNRAQVVAAE